ncbi:MAG: molybdopterin molybdotransferase MoeA, partial [Bacteroidetes bacterium]|nr:molybdopterin molybdotransferase MoeA [Bacteroidota bacterium]
KEKTARNICYRAEDIKNGQKVLDIGTRIEPAHLAVLASVGNTKIWVARQPHIGIISTGNELVEPDQKPDGSQIRNSNAWQLLAQARQIPVRCSYFGIADDSPEELKDKLSMGLYETDIVILTGGVSMGDFDYVPAAMESLGASILFKSIAIQPGRPTVFARYNDQFIFGLPGNPVSSFVLFELMVKPFVLKMMGCHAEPLVLSLPMGVDFSRKKSSRKSVIPVMIEKGVVYPLEYHGSAHINAYTNANGMMIMDIGQTEIKKGEPADVRPL